MEYHRNPSEIIGALQKMVLERIRMGQTFLEILRHLKLSEKIFII